MIFHLLNAMRYSLRTLLILLLVAPPVLGFAWWLAPSGRAAISVHASWMGEVTL